MIMSVAIEIAHDNGMINRSTTKEEFINGAVDIISHRPLIEIIKLEVFLKTKTPAELTMIAAGEHTDAQHVFGDTPDKKFADDLFEEIFEWEKWTGLT